MGQAEIAPGLHSVAYSVTKIQQPPLSIVELISGHHISLHFHAALDHIGFVKIFAVLFQITEEISIEENGVLDNLSAAIPENFPWESIQCVRVTQNQTGLPEGSNQIFAHAQVNGRLAAYRGIYSSQ